MFDIDIAFGTLSLNDLNQFSNYYTFDKNFEEKLNAAKFYVEYY